MPTLWPETTADVLVSFSWTWPQAFLNKASAKAVEQANALHPARKGGKELYPTATVSIAPAGLIDKTPLLSPKWVDLGYIMDEGITFEPQVPNVQSWSWLPTQQFSDPPTVLASWDSSITGKFVPTPEQITALKASVDEAKMLADTAAASMKAVLDDKIIEALKVTPPMAQQQPKVHALRAIVHPPCTVWFTPDGPPGDQLWVTNEGKVVIGYGSEITSVTDDSSVELYSWGAADAIQTIQQGPKVTYEVTWRPRKTEHHTISNAMERGYFTSANEVKATLGTYRPNTDTWVLEIGGGGFVETENSDVMHAFGMVPGFMTATGPVLSAAQIVAGYQEFGYGGGVFGDGGLAKQSAKYLASITGASQSHQPKATRLQEFIPGLRESKPFRCPVPGCTNPPQAVWYQIQHINDTHSMSREQIADWLDSLEGIDLTVHLPEDEITEKKEA